VNHENSTSEKHTWSALTNLNNSSDPDEGVNLFDSVLPMDKHNHLTTNPGYKAVDLTNCSTMPIGGWEIKKYILSICRSKCSPGSLVYFIEIFSVTYSSPRLAAVRDMIVRLFLISTSCFRTHANVSACVIGRNSKFVHFLVLNACQCIGVRARPKFSVTVSLSTARLRQTNACLNLTAKH
jgi:hypothetical protein